MATASTLIVGQEYPVRSGAFAGHKVRIISTDVVPDGQPEQRKMLVHLIEDDGGVCPVYILPRLIDDLRSSRVTEAVAAPAAPAPVLSPLVKDEPITDPMDPRLDAWRPSPRIVRNYVSRVVPGGLKDVDFLLSLWEQKDENGYSPNILLAGDTQAGKTMLVEVLAVLLAKKLGYPKPLPVFLLSGSSGITDYELFGQTMAYTGADGVERLVYMPGIIAMAATIKHAILYLDETNAFGEKVTTAMHPVLDDRRYFINTKRAIKVPGDGYSPDVVKVSPGCWVLGTFNPGYRGMGMHNEAFINRFRVIPWGYDEAVEKKLVSSPAVRLLGAALREARAARTISTPVGTKALQRLDGDLHNFPVETCLWTFTGLFQPNEQPKVHAIIQDRSIKQLLDAESAARAAEAQRIEQAQQAEQQPENVV